MVSLTAVGSILGGLGALAGAGTQADNAAAGQQASLLNYTEQRRANALREALARQNLRRQDQGITTGTGTTSRYEPGRGFVTTLSPLEASIAGGQQAQAARSATRGVQRRGALEDRDFSQRLRAGSLGDTILRQLEEPNVRTRAGTEAELRSADRRGTSSRNNALLDQVGNAVLRQGGLTNNRALMAAMSGGLNNTFDTGRAYGLEADEIFGNRTATNRSNDINALNALRGISTPGATPVPAQSQADNTTANLQRGTNNAFNLAIGATGAPQRQAVPDSFATSNLLNSLGSGLYGYGQYRDAQDKYDKLIEAVSNRQTTNQGAGNPGR